MKMLFEKLPYVNELWTEGDEFIDRDVSEAFQLSQILLHHVDEKIADDFDSHTGVCALSIL